MSETQSETFLTVRHQRKENKKAAKQEREVPQKIKGKFLWGVYKSEHSAYEPRHHLRHGFLKDFVEERKKRFGKVFGLDLMSDTAALRSLGIGGIAVGLADVRTKDEISKDTAGSRAMVSEDVLSPLFWKETLPEVKKRLGITFFDVIFVSSYGAGEKLTGISGVHHRLASDLWPHVHPDGGKVFIEYVGTNRDDLTSWVDRLNATEGIVAVLNQPDQSLCVTRSLGAPEKLPH